MRYNLHFFIVLIFLLCLFNPGYSQIITTIAGSAGTSTATGDSGSAVTATIGQPSGIATDRHGNIYFTDPWNNVVRKVGASGIIYTIAGVAGTGSYSGDGAAATNAHLNLPEGICVDYYGNVFFADKGNFIVREIDTNGIIKTVAGTPLSHGYSGSGGAATACTLNGAADVAINPLGGFLIADGKYYVLSVDAAGNINIIAGSSPGFSGDGRMGTDAQLNGTNSIDIDASGNIYVADEQNNVIRCITSTGIINTVAGYYDSTSGGGFSGDGGPATAALLNNPSAITVDSAGDMYITDQGNNVIRYVSALSGQINTYTGDTTAGYSGDSGPADSASLNQPADCAVNNHGYLFIADKNNNVIRQVTPPVVFISTVSLSVCSGNRVLFNAAAGVTGTVHYHWQVNGAHVGTDSISYNADSVNNGDTVQCVLTLGASTDTLGISNTLVMTVNTTFSTSISISILPGDTICSSVPVDLYATPVNSGHLPEYYWYVNDSEVLSGADTHYAYIPSSGDFVVCKMASSVTCPTIRLASSNIIHISVLPAYSPSVHIATTSDTICLGSTATFTALPINGGTTPIFYWYDNGTIVGSDSASITFTPAAGDSISCVMVSNYICLTTDSAFSDTIVMSTTTSFTPVVTIGASGGDTTCSGTPVSFIAYPVNGGGMPAFHWTVNGSFAGTGSPWVYTPSAGDVVRCTLISSLVCRTVDSVTSDSLKMTVITVSTPVVTTTYSADTVCSSASIIFNATGINAGSAPIYDWFKNNTYFAVGSTFTMTSPVNGDSVFCVLHSNAMCVSPDTAKSAVTHVVVNPLLTPAVSISASTRDTICAETSVTFTATPVHGGSSPTYLWLKNGVGVDTGSTYTTTTLVNGDIIKCKLTSDAICATPDTAISGSITMTVNPLLTPTVGITLSTRDTVCSGTRVTFTTDTFSHGGTAPTFEWNKNGVNISAGTSYSYTPANGDIIKCVITSNATCAMPDTGVSNTIVMTVNPIDTPAIMVTASPSGAICAGTSVTYTTAIINGGSAPAYQWIISSTHAGTDTTSYTYDPSNGDTVICRLVSNASCIGRDTVYSRPIVMTVNPIVTPSISITVSSDTVCAGSSVTYTATAVHGGSAPTYKWYKNGHAVGLALSVYTDTPAIGDTVYCRVFSNAPCTTVDSANSNYIIVHITPVLAPLVTLSATHDTVCSGTRVTYTATVSNAGSHPTYHWKVNVGYVVDTGSTYTYTPLNLDQIRCIVISDYVCPSPDSAISDTVLMRVLSSARPTLALGASPDTVCAGTSISFVATSGNAGSTPSYMWFVNGSGTDTGTHYSFIPLPGDRVTCELISSALCASPDTLLDTAHIVVNANMTPTVHITASPGTTLLNGESVTFTASVTYGGSTPVYQWEVNGHAVSGATDSTFTCDTLSYGAVVTCVVTSNYPCVTQARDTSNTDSIIISNVGVPIVNSISGNMSIHPNPNTGVFTIKGFTNETYNTTATITVTDMLGKTVFKTEAPIKDRNINTGISLDNTVANGMYLLNISYDGNSNILHFVVAR